MKQVNSLTPIQLYFGTLPQWSVNDPDYIRVLAHYVLVSHDQEAFVAYLKEHLVKAVERVFYGSTANAQCLVLAGEQGCGKSSFIRFLCPKGMKAYLFEGMPLTPENEAQLQDSFMANLDDLSTYSPTDIDAYERLLVSHKSTSFFGSTNDLTFTANPKYWRCFTVENIHKAYSHNIDIRYVWAQAYALFTGVSQA